MTAREGKPTHDLMVEIDEELWTWVDQLSSSSARSKWEIVEEALNQYRERESKKRWKELAQKYPDVEEVRRE